jgi:hypothetical protein
MAKEIHQVYIIYLVPITAKETTVLNINAFLA